VYSGHLSIACIENAVVVVMSRDVSMARNRCIGCRCARTGGRIG